MARLKLKRLEKCALCNKQWISLTGEINTNTISSMRTNSTYTATLFK